MKTKKLVLAAVLAALFVALSYVAVDLRLAKLTFAGLPVIIAGLVLGPVGGAEVGFVGGMLEQILKYGITATTLLWVVPEVVRGLMVGLYAKKHGYSLTKKQLCFITIVSGLVVTVINTFNLYVDSKLYGYYTFAGVFGLAFVRAALSVATSLIYMLVLPVLVQRLRSVIGSESRA